jgi:histone H3/H4
MGRRAQVPQEVDLDRQKARSSGGVAPSVQQIKSKGSKTIPVTKKNGGDPTTLTITAVKKKKVASSKKTVEAAIKTITLAAKQPKTPVSKLRSMTNIGFGAAPSRKLIKKIAESMRDDFISEGLMVDEYEVTSKGKRHVKKTGFRVSKDAVEILTRSLSAQVTQLINSAAISTVSKGRQTIGVEDLAICVLSTPALEGLYPHDFLVRAASGIRGDMPLASRFVRPRVTAARLKKQVADMRKKQQTKALKQAGGAPVVADTEEQEEDENQEADADEGNENDVDSNIAQADTEEEPETEYDEMDQQ